MTWIKNVKKRLLHLCSPPLPCGSQRLWWQWRCCCCQAGGSMPVSRHVTADLPMRWSATDDQEVRGSSCSRQPSGHQTWRSSWPGRSWQGRQGHDKGRPFASLRLRSHRHEYEWSVRGHLYKHITQRVSIDNLQRNWIEWMLCEKKQQYSTT